MTPGATPRHFGERNGWVVRAFQGALAAVTSTDSLVGALEAAKRGGAQDQWPLADREQVTRGVTSWHSTRTTTGRGSAHWLRTVAVATLYGATHHGVEVRQAWDDVAGALPGFAPQEFLVDAVEGLCKA